MSWDKRQRGGRYYVRSRRAHGRVTNTYFGNGARARAAARHDVAERARALRERRVQHDLDERISALERALDDFCRLTEALAALALAAAGYHQHHRGEWRKRRATNGAPGAAPRERKAEQHEEARISL